MTDEGGAGYPDDALARELREAHRVRLRTDMVRGSLWTLLSATLLLPVTFVVNLVVAHSLGPQGLGRLTTYTAILSVAALLANLGTSDATVQWLAEARALGNAAAETTLIRQCAGYHAFVEGPLLAFVTGAMLWHTGLFPAFVAAISVWLTQALGTSTVILTATARNVAAARMALVMTMATQATIASVSATTHSPPLTLAYSLGISALRPVVAFIPLSPAHRRATLSPKLTWQAPSGFRRYALSACAGGLVAGLVYGRSEIFVLRANGLLVATGLFAICTGLAGQLTVPMDSLMGPLVPTVAGIYATAPERALGALKRALRVTSTLGALTAATLVPALYIALPSIYGQRYVGAEGAFAALGLVSCVQSVIAPIAAFALATRSAAAVLKNDLFCLAVDAALAVTLIPLLGLAGAVIANVSAQTLGLILIARVVTRRLGAHWKDVALASRAFVLGPLVAVTAAILARSLPFTRPVQAVVSVGLGLMLLALLMQLLPAWRLHDADIVAISDGLPQRLRPAFSLGVRATRIGSPRLNSGSDRS